MSLMTIDDTLDMYYELDSFVEPWRAADTVLLVHGIGGCTAEWFAWVPPLAAEYSVLRVDLRGWGRSTEPPEGYEWSMDSFADDLAKLLDQLGIERVHLVGTKLGGRIALHMAQNHAHRLSSMTLVCTPLTLRADPSDNRNRRPTREGGAAGVERWARETMAERLGQVSPEMMVWWIDLYGRSRPRVISDVFDLAWWTDEFEILQHVTTPTLVVDSDAVLTTSKTREWQTQIPHAQVVPIPITTEGRQLSASKPEACCTALLEFLAELRS